MGLLLLSDFSVILDAVRITLDVFCIHPPTVYLWGTSASSIFERYEFFDFHLDQLPSHLDDDKTCWSEV